jgi:hypothetical protein
VMERIRLLIARIRPATQRIWTGHRVVVIAVSVIAVVAIVAGTLLIAVMPGGTAQASATPAATATATPTESPLPSDSPSPEPSASAIDLSPALIPADWVPSDLDGVFAPVDLAHRLPMAIMIDDNEVARPQSGISSASIVYQAYADGGEDRYMMIWQEGTATDIGPVRSARPYYVYWAVEYKALYGHFGGDANSLQRVVPANLGNLYNMDDLRGGSCPYRRIDTRAAPHNAYTNVSELVRCTARLGYPAMYQNLPTRTFKDDIPLAERPASQSIVVPYRTGSISYQYDPTTDSYLRMVKGFPQIDPANGNQVFAHNIVVMYQVYGNDPGAMDEASRPYVFNQGSGEATVFKEGKAITATWKKPSPTALTRLYDSSGTEIPFVRGEIFMQSVPPGTAVTVK